MLRDDIVKNRQKRNFYFRFMFFNLLSLLFTADGQVPVSMHSIVVTFNVDCFLTASIQREFGIKT